MDKNQEYYHSGGYGTIYGEVKDKPEEVIFAENGDYGELHVVRRSELVKKEDSYSYQQAQKRADELRAITAKAQENFDQLVEKLIKKTTSALSARMKLNILFGKDMSSSAGFGMAIANELEKLVKEDAAEVIKQNK